VNGSSWLKFALALLILALVFFFAQTCDAQEPVTITVRDFGRGMEPGLNPYANDPEALVYSTNFYSTAPGTRQLRFGLRGVFSDSIAASDEAIQSLIHFQPKNDSSAFVYTAGGYWFSSWTGYWQWGSITPSFDWKGAIANAAQIRPFQEETDTVATDADSVVGTRTRFFRDYQAGDKIIVGIDQPDTQTILHITSDTKLWIEGTWDSVGTYPDHRMVRAFQTGQADPFLHQSGDLLYTGTPSDHPQVIYVDENDTLRIRPLKVVDSVHIDTASYNVTDSVRGNSIVISGGDTTIEYLEIVDRNKSWVPDYWAADINGDPRSYYFWMGTDSTDTASMQHTFRILGNTDSSLRLEVLFVDSSTVLDSQYWMSVNDTIADSVYEGLTGYICTAVGQLKTVIANSATTSIGILEGGAIWRTEQDLISAANIDSLNYGNHYIHLLEPASVASPTEDSTRIVTIEGPCASSFTSRLPDIDTSKETIIDHHVDYGVKQERDEQISWCIHTWTIASTPALSQRGAIEDRYFKIAHVVRNTDTTWFVTTGPYDLSADTVTVTEWEIVKAEMPYWGGMDGFQRRLVAWGDSLSGSRVNMSVADKDWDWTQSDDLGTPLEFTVGSNASDIIRLVLPYDDRMIFFLQNSMIGYPGFTELSRTLSVAGPKAAIVLDKAVYWAWVDGIYRMDRRDFSGYSSQKISSVMDPVFNAWNTTAFGTDYVPFKLLEGNRSRMVLSHNQRDNHLYAFYSQSGTANTHALTYSLDRNIWDGNFDIAATDAIWTTYGDTSSIIIGSPDSATLFALDYAFADILTPYDGDLKSKRFWLTDQGGRPVESRLQEVRFVSRSISGGLDTAYVNIIGDSATTTLTLAHNAAMSDVVNKLWGQSHNTSVYWRWQLVTEGAGTGNVFFPIELNMTFVPVRRNR